MLDTKLDAVDNNIVEEICKGKNMADVARDLGVSHHEVQKRVRRLIGLAMLPKETRAWIAVKDKVMGNIQNLEDMNQKIDQLVVDHLGTMHRFEF